MQVTVHKSTDGQFFESFEAYKAHEEALQVNAKLADANLNLSAFSKDDRDNDVLFPENVAKFVAANADKLREVLNSSVVVKRGRAPGKKAAEKAAA